MAVGFASACAPSRKVGTGPPSGEGKQKALLLTLTLIGRGIMQYAI